ncbi:MAG: recombination mediator RecR [Pseudomonadota bacterium]
MSANGAGERDETEGGEIEALIALMARLPGLGPRSARRAALHLVRNREALLAPLAQAMAQTALKARPCKVCGAIDTAEICGVCRDPRRDDALICVVEEVGDLWAMERAGVYRGRYHVLGGLLSALDGVGPEALRIPELAERVTGAGRNLEGGGAAADRPVDEVILALPATVDGQTTAHVIAEALAGGPARVTTLARGVPLGGELGYLDEGTIQAALGARRELG